MIVFLTNIVTLTTTVKAMRCKGRTRMRLTSTSPNGRPGSCASRYASNFGVRWYNCISANMVLDKEDFLGDWIVVIDAKLKLPLSSLHVLSVVNTHTETRKPLQPPYDGPYMVLELGEHS